MAFGRRKKEQVDPFATLDSLIAGLEEETGYRVDTKGIGDKTFIEWCEHLAADGLKVDGKPFKLDDRPALRPIYEAIPSTPEEAKDGMLICMKATQLGLTVWEVLANIYMACKWEPISIGMFMPSQSTAIHKSEHRFMRMVRSAPQLYKLLTTGRAVDGKEEKIGEGNVLTRKIGESLLLFLWTTGKVTTESIPMDVVTLDEVQEMALDHIDKVLARMGDSHIQFGMMLSTANMPDLDIHFWYLEGTQEVWHTECEHCGAFSDLSDPAGNFPDKSIGYNTGQWPGAPMNEYIWTCPACKGWIKDPQRGKLIVTNPGANPKIRSFLLPRTISPRMTPRKMAESWARAKTGDQKKSFYNRTLGRPYIDADQLPVTMAHCLAAAEAGIKAGLKWKQSARHTYMGIDQMGSFNAVIIKERMPDGRQAVVHVEAVFNNDPFERCSELMDLYGVEVCVVEQLPNVNDARRFANRHPGRVFLAGYVDMRDDQMHWGDDLSKSDKRTSVEDRSRYTVTLNQYKCMQTALFRIRDGACLFPDPNELVQDVVDGGVVKRIPILRDWAFFHFTKTALVVDIKDDERKAKPKVLKVGIDPHYAFANMLCDVAWARSYGTSTMILPTQDTTKQAATERAEKMEMHGLPTHVAAMIQDMPTGQVCARCVAFNHETGLCEERLLQVRAADPGCVLFTAKS